MPRLSRQGQPFVSTQGSARGVPSRRQVFGVTPGIHVGYMFMGFVGSQFACF